MKRLWWVPVLVLGLLLTAWFLIRPGGDGPRIDDKAANGARTDAHNQDEQPRQRGEDSTTPRTPDDDGTGTGPGRTDAVADGYHIVARFDVPGTARLAGADLLREITAHHDDLGSFHFRASGTDPLTPENLDTAPPATGWDIQPRVSINSQPVTDANLKAGVRLEGRTLHIEVEWDGLLEGALVIGRYLHTSGHALQNAALNLGVPGHGWIKTRCGRDGRIALLLPGPPLAEPTWWFAPGNEWDRRPPTISERRPIAQPEPQAGIHDLGDLLFNGSLIKFVLEQAEDFPDAYVSVDLYGGHHSFGHEGRAPLLVPALPGQCYYNATVFREKSDMSTNSGEVLSGSRLIPGAIGTLEGELTLLPETVHEVVLVLPRPRTVTVSVQTLDGPASSGELVMSTSGEEQSLGVVNFPYALDVGRDPDTDVRVHVAGWHTSFWHRVLPDAMELTIYLERRTHDPDAPTLKVVHNLGDTPYHQHRSYWLTPPDQSAAIEVPHLEEDRDMDALSVPEPGQWTLWVYGGARFGHWGGVLAGGLEVEITQGTNVVTLPEPPEPAVAEQHIRMRLQCGETELDINGAQMQLRRADGGETTRITSAQLAVGVVDGDRTIPLDLTRVESDPDTLELRGDMPVRVRVVASGEVPDGRYSLEIESIDRTVWITAKMHNGVAELWAPPGPARLTAECSETLREQSWPLDLRRDRVVEVALKPEPSTEVNFVGKWGDDVQGSQRMGEVWWVINNEQDPANALLIRFDAETPYDGQVEVRRLIPGRYEAECVAPGNLRGRVAFEVTEGTATQTVNLEIPNTGPTGTIEFRLPEGVAGGFPWPGIIVLRQPEHVQEFIHTATSIGYTWSVANGVLRVLDVPADRPIGVYWMEGLFRPTHTCRISVVTVGAGETVTLAPETVPMRALSMEWIAGMEVYWVEHAGAHTFLRRSSSRQTRIPVGTSRFVLIRDGVRHEITLDVPAGDTPFEIPPAVRAELGLGD